MVLYIFIDADNKKRYYKEQFRADFYLSSSSSIINNDYIMDKNNPLFTKYTTTDWNSFLRLKYAINNNITDEINSV